QSFTQCYIMNQSFVSTIIILLLCFIFFFFFFQAEDGIRDGHVTGVQTCALPISWAAPLGSDRRGGSQKNEPLISVPAVRHRRRHRTASGGAPLARAGGEIGADLQRPGSGRLGGEPGLLVGAGWHDRGEAGWGEGQHLPGDQETVPELSADRQREGGRAERALGHRLLGL